MTDARFPGLSLRGTLLAMLVACGVFLPTAGEAAVPPFRPGVNMQRALDSQVGVTWRENPLRDGLMNLANGQAFALLLDRRIDPQRKISFTAQDERLEVVLLRLAEQQKLGFATVGPVFYLGPPATAQRLASIAAARRWEANQAGATLASKLAATKEAVWDDLAQPRELVVVAAKAYGLTVANPEAIPHDLWPAAKWPALNAADRLTLLLAGFDLTYELDAPRGEIRLVPLPEHRDIGAAHTVRGEPAKALADIKKLFPQLAPEISGKQLIVEAPYETHEKIYRLLSGEQVRTTKVTSSTKRYTMTVKGEPAGAVASTVAKELGKELKFAADLRPKLEQRVNFMVKDVTLEELLNQALDPLGLRYQVTDAELEILAKE